MASGGLNPHGIIGRKPKKQIKPKTLTEESHALVSRVFFLIFNLLSFPVFFDLCNISISSYLF